MFGVAFERGEGVGPAGDPPALAASPARGRRPAGAPAACSTAPRRSRALDWRHTPTSLADAEALRVALAHACETTRQFAVEGAGYARGGGASDGGPGRAPPGRAASRHFFPERCGAWLVSSRAFAFAVALEGASGVGGERARWRDRAVPDLGLARVRAAIRAAAYADAATSFPTVSSSSAETLFTARGVGLAALEAWARSGAPSGLLASGDADGERLVARAVDVRLRR